MTNAEIFARVDEDVAKEVKQDAVLATFKRPVLAVAPPKVTLATSAAELEAAVHDLLRAVEAVATETFGWAHSDNEVFPSVRRASVIGNAIDTIQITRNTVAEISALVATMSMELR